MIFSVCSWVVVEVALKSKRKESSQLLKTSKLVSLISIMQSILTSKLIDKEYAEVVMVKEELMRQLFKHVRLVREEE